MLQVAYIINMFKLLLGVTSNDKNNFYIKVKFDDISD